MASADSDGHVFHAAAIVQVILHLELEAELDSDAEVMRYLTGRAVSRAEVETGPSAPDRRRAQGARLGFWVGFDRDDFIGWRILQPPHGPDMRAGSPVDLPLRRGVRLCEVCQHPA
jgi:hypothetical protein